MQRLYTKPPPNSSPLINISVVGMNGSGKSAITVKYLTNRFIVEYAPYLSDIYTKTDSIDGQEVTLSIQDTSDSDEIDLDEVMRWSHAVIVVFSITSRRSFYRAQELVESLKQCVEQRTSSQPTLSNQQRPPLSSPGGGSTVQSGLPKPSAIPPLIPGYMGAMRRMANLNTTSMPKLILVANKADLDRFRLVEKSEAEDYASTHGLPYIETTATEYCHEVQAMFHTVVRLTTTTTTAATPSPISRNGKLRLPSGSSVGSPGLSSPPPTSVLSSLAATPGLLIQPQQAQKKQPTMSTSGEAMETSSTTAASVSPVSLLTNLRFRAASPPTFGKTLRNPSPGWGPRSPTATGASGNKGLSRPASYSTGERPSGTRTNQADTAPPVPTRPASQPGSTQAAESAGAGTETTATTTVAPATKTTAVQHQQPPAAAQAATKKPTIGFGWFGKKPKEK